MNKYTYVMEMRDEDSSNVFEAMTATQKVVELEKKLATGMNLCFEKKMRKKKSSEPPRMTKKIRQWIVRRRAVFKRCGRNAVWRRIKRRTIAAIQKRRRGYTEFLKDKFMSSTSANGFYHCVNSVTNVNHAPKWTVRSMYPGMSDEEIAEVLAKFVNDISAEKEPLCDDQIPRTFDCELPRVLVSEVADRLKEMKKPRSQVPGDADPSIYELSACHLASAISNVFNCISSTREWPGP